MMMSESVLILQEREGGLDYVALELERAGYRVVTVPKLSVAISWLRVNDPVLIVAPVHLLDDNVFDLLRFVRSDFQLKHTKILLYCVTKSLFTLGMGNTISSAARAMGASAVFIGNSFDARAFWQIVDPLLQHDSTQKLAQDPSPGPAAHDASVLDKAMSDQEISHIEM